jgi:hypothetical protein
MQLVKKNYSKGKAVSLFNSAEFQKLETANWSALMFSRHINTTAYFYQYIVTIRFKKERNFDSFKQNKLHGLWSASKLSLSKT